MRNVYSKARPWRRVWWAVGLAVMPAMVCAAETDAVTLPDVVVTADPLARTADDLARPVDVLGGDELDKKRRNTLGETLETQLGVSTTDFGAGAGRPVIRGQAGPRVQVLENGIASMDASDVSTDHAVTVSPASAEQVEILKGPATLIYGSGASGGVVNVVNKRLPDGVVDGVSSEAQFGYGDNADARNGSVDLNYGSGGTQLHVDAAASRAGDYEIPGAANADGSGPRDVLPNSAVDTRTAGLSAAQFWSRGSAALAYSRYTTTYGLPIEETAFIDLQQDRYDWEAKLQDPLPGFDGLRLRGGYTDYMHTEFEAPGEPGTRFTNQQTDNRLEATHRPLAGWRGVVGLQQVYRDFAAVGEESFVPPSVSRSLAVFVVEERPTDFGKLEAGIRYGVDSAKPEGMLPDRDFRPLSFSAGVVWALDPRHHLRFDATRSQRAPVAEELYAFGPHGATGTYERGDPNLDIETIDNFEASIDRHEGRLRWQAAVYYERARDYIYLDAVDQGLNADGSGTANADGEPDRVDDEGNFDPDGDFLLVDSKAADARFFGIETEASYALIESAAGALAARIWGDTVRGELSDGRNLPRITPGRVGFGLDGDHGAFGGSIDVYRVLKQDRVSALETATAGYTMLNAELHHDIDLARVRGRLFLRGRNLLDEEARRHTSFIKDQVPMPGRNVLAGFELQFP